MWAERRDYVCDSQELSSGCRGSRLRRVNNRDVYERKDMLQALYNASQMQSPMPSIILTASTEPQDPDLAMQ